MADKDTQNVELAFGMIRSAATLLSAFPFGEAAASLRRQEEMSYLTDPTLAQNTDREDLKRKLRLLDAAASFIREWDAVKVEALKFE